VLRIARRAAALVMEVYQAPFEVELKGPGDPVTEADRGANTLICEALAEHFPEAAVVAEESVPSDPEAVASLVARERVFFVDPVDGTREFAAKNGEFAVMIGLAVRGEAQLGVLIEPTTGRALVGRVGGASFLEEADGRRSALQLSSQPDASLARMVVSRSRRPSFLAPVLQRLGHPRLIPCGSVGIKVARLALGEAELYVHGGGGVKRWDTCGPEAVLRAAGGCFTDLGGRAFDYGLPELAALGGLLVASNPSLHAAALEALQEPGAR
jgi:3'(2'), 5'-bisphosphate nucleotidase